MSVSIVPPQPGLSAGLRLIRDTQMDATPEKNALGVAGTLFMLAIDNGANAAIEYVKIYDAQDATVGTTDPDFTFPIAASSKKTIFCPSGVTLDTGLTFACVSDGGGTAGTTNPGSAVTGSIMAQDS